MEDILDFDNDRNEPKHELTQYGKLFYILEIALWASSFLLLVFAPFYAVFAVPVLLLFYLIAGALFPFYSGAFKFDYDKIGVLASMVSLVMLIGGIMFRFQGLEISSGYFYFNLLLSIGVIVFLLGRLYPSSSNILLKWMDFGGYDELGTSHLRYTFIRAVIHFFISASIALAT